MERQQSIIQQLEKNHLTNYEFIDSTIFETTKLVNLKYSEKDLFLKHISLYRKISLDTADYAMILEDDAIFVEQFIEKLNKCIHQLPTNFDIVFTGGGCNLVIPSSQLQPNQYIYHKGNESTSWGGNGCTRCTDGYIIHKKCAQTIYSYFMSEIDKISSPIDWWLNHVARVFNLNVFWVEPQISHNGSQTSIKSSI
jgi:GR25 family glycosyltransferase involved in LPS biosynthesis